MCIFMFAAAETAGRNINVKAGESTHDLHSTALLSANAMCEEAAKSLHGRDDRFHVACLWELNETGRGLERMDHVS